jgi:DNA polymerase IV
MVDNYRIDSHAEVKLLLGNLYACGQLIRLIGMCFTHLIAGTYQINLFADTQEMIKLYQAIDSVKNNTEKSI